MDRILLPEYLAYEEGFIDGKDDTMLRIYETINGEQVDEYFYEEEEFPQETFYAYGYEDATRYYTKKYQECRNVESLILENETMIDDCFTERVIKHNTITGEQIRIGVFKTKIK